MANAILNALLDFLKYILNILLSPLNALIATLVPDTTTAFTYINGFWSLLSRYGSFALSYLGISREIISICILLYIPIITIPFAVHFFKLIARWWETIT